MLGQAFGWHWILRLIISALAKLLEADTQLSKKPFGLESNINFLKQSAVRKVQNTKVSLFSLFCCMTSVATQCLLFLLFKERTLNSLKTDSKKWNASRLIWILSIHFKLSDSLSCWHWFSCSDQETKCFINKLPQLVSEMTETAMILFYSMYIN